jgi:hypothetical protein
MAKNLSAQVSENRELMQQKMNKIDDCHADMRALIEDFDG